MCDVDRLYKFFWQLHHCEPVVVRSPGRINLIGEHTDYNNGFVLPAAINKSVYAAVSKRNDDEIHLHAAEYNENYIALLSKLRQPKHHWSSYALGVVEQLVKKGFEISGFNIVIDSDVPVGAGMASSAAIECATAFALNELFSLNLDKIDIVKIAQKAEQEFIGLQCGVMDMFASMFGKKDQVIKLDCRSLEYEYVPFRRDGIKIVLLDTSIKHALAFSEYNLRRKQCEEGVAIINEKHSEVKSLRDVTLKKLDECIAKNTTVYKRCRFVIEENERLINACEDLQNNDLTSFGKKMYKTHEGLSKLYEVSSAQLDCLVKIAKSEPSVIGARMMGGGFGGCTINIVKEDGIEELIYNARCLYREKTGMNLNAYIALIDEGASQVKNYSTV